MYNTTYLLYESELFKGLIMHIHKKRLRSILFLCAFFCAILSCPFSFTHGQAAHFTAKSESYALPDDALVGTVYYGQTGNPFADALAGNLPFTDEGRGDAWSFFSLLISSIGIVMGTGIAVSTALLPKQRISYSGNRKAFRTLRTVASLFSLLPFLLYVLQSNLRKPAVWFCDDTVWVCLLFTLAFCTYIISHIAGNEDKKRTDSELNAFHKPDVGAYD